MERKQRQREIIKAFEMLHQAYEKIPKERMGLAGKFLIQDNRTLPLESVKAWILRYNRAPYINELYEMSVECSDD